MAIDQALLESVEADRRATLRLYVWSEPTLSIGYFQKLSDRVGHDESAGLACVRRATGGGAILHHHELTYSVVIPVERQTGPRMDLYQQTHLAVINVLSEYGIGAIPFRLAGSNRGPLRDSEKKDSSVEPFLCFQRRSDEDLIVGGYKVLGSAQRKSRHAVLQHGSLLIRASKWGAAVARNLRFDLAVDLGGRIRGEIRLVDGAATFH